MKDLIMFETISRPKASHGVIFAMFKWRWHGLIR